MSSKKLVSLFAYALLTLGLSSGTAWAQCPIAQWSNTVPAINQLHIFCGEISNNGVPKGYHSKVYAPPTDVVTAVQDGPVSASGVYDGQVSFVNHTSKFSTFFPNACTQAQILASVVYANANRRVPQPAVPWGFVGPSAPAQGGAQYCLGANGTPIDIRFAVLPNSTNINTAFPYR